MQQSSPQVTTKPDWFTPSTSPTIHRTPLQMAKIRHHEWWMLGIKHPRFECIAENVNGSNIFTWENDLYMYVLGSERVTLLCQGR